MTAHVRGAERIDATTSAGKHILGVIPEFERERVERGALAGLACARGEDRRLGRPRNAWPTFEFLAAECAR